MRALQKRLEQLVMVHRQLLRKYAQLELEKSEARKLMKLRDDRIAQLDGTCRKWLVMVGGGWWWQLLLLLLVMLLLLLLLVVVVRGKLKLTLFLSSCSSFFFLLLKNNRGND